MTDIKGEGSPSFVDPLIMVFRHCRPEQTESFRLDLDYSAAPKDYAPGPGYDLSGGKMVKRNGLWYFCHKNVLYDLKYFACLIEVSYAKVSELRDRDREIYVRLRYPGQMFDLRGTDPAW